MKKLKVAVSSLCLIALLTFAVPTVALASDGPQGGSNSRSECSASTASTFGNFGKDRGSYPQSDRLRSLSGEGENVRRAHPQQLFRRCMRKYLASMSSVSISSCTIVVHHQPASSELSSLKR